MSRIKDEAGKTYGYWKVLSRANNRVFPNGKVAATWNCLCTKCGKEKIVIGQSLRAGDTKSCCLGSKYHKKPRGEAAFNRILDQYKRGAKKRGYVWKLKREEFRTLTKGNCHYCGKSPKKIYNNGQVNGEYIYNGIDRLDATMGYLITNCVPCCEWCNRMKWIKTKKQFLEQIACIQHTADQTIKLGT